MPAGGERPTVAIIAQRLENLEKKVDGHDTFIDGNGKPGAKVEIATMQAQLRVLLEQVGDIKKQLTDMTKAAWGLVTAIGIAVVTYLLTSVLPDIIGHIGQ